MSEKPSPIADRRMWCGQMEARAVMYAYGPDTFELYLSHAGSVPIRFVGGIGILNNKVDHWTAARKAEGYVEQLPSYNPYPREV